MNVYRSTSNNSQPLVMTLSLEQQLLASGDDSQSLVELPAWHCDLLADIAASHGSLSKWSPGIAPSQPDLASFAQHGCLDHSPGLVILKHPNGIIPLELISVIIICTVLYMKLMRWLETRNYYRLVAKVRLRREAAFKKMKNAINQIKEMETYQGNSDSAHFFSLPDLCKSINKGDVSPSYVLHAYLEQALEATRKFNCIVDFLPECQTQLADLHNAKKGLLYGIPVSIKESINYKDHDSTCGLRKFINRPASEDSVIVKVLKKQGAIPFVKTNVPQTLLSFECSNPIYGQTINPLNAKRSPGGSSGGEATLIAAGGSILGIGTDLGGSIRFPAACCGICGFKPTSNRLSKIGLTGNMAGQKIFESMVGPLAKDVDSLALCMKALLCEDMFHLDPSVPPIPFNEQMYTNTKRLRIGYFENDEYWIPTPSMKRAVLETKELLEKAGHTLVSFTPPNVYNAMNELVFPGLLADKCVTLMESLKGDVIDPSMKFQISICSVPEAMKKFLYYILKPFVSTNVCSQMDLAEGKTNKALEISVKDLWKLHYAAMAYRDEYLNAWRKNNIEVLLCPSIGPAFKLGCGGKLSAASSYTIIFSLLNCPAGVVPVTKVTEEDEEELQLYKGYINDFWDKVFKKGVTGGVGLPLSVQCVALPWHDELCLCFMKEVERLVRKRKGTLEPLDLSRQSIDA
ncbi:fatty-acid amide hydrolase 1-like [Chiloscyllium plagiosum]|uniref:fatty-acid amide hydrolase 1-like n=1 Tax=Chiloscyllium plagiosum TaxID=36176 RepID=UPI001CB7DCE2|nr:fatty-acid amide hydrolase 1-like [Chiloscyllium plagiosum]